MVDSAVYLDGRRSQDGLESIRLDGQSAGHAPFAWVGLRMPAADELADACGHLGGADLPFDDIVAPHDRPILVLDGNSVQLVLRTAKYLESSDAVQLGELSVILAPYGVVTARFGHATPLGDLRHRLEDDPEWLRLGPSAVLASILGEVIDDYRPALDGFERDAVEVERDVFSDSARRPARRLYRLKRELRIMLLAIGSLQEPLGRLIRVAEDRFPEPVLRRIQEASEQLERTISRAESLSNLLDAALGATLAQISVQQNDDMRRISAWVAMAAGPTLIAGVYGMNFDAQPELHWRYGYPLVLGAMLLLSAALFRAFRRAGWL